MDTDAFASAVLEREATSRGEWRVISATDFDGRTGHWVSTAAAGTAILVLKHGRPLVTVKRVVVHDDDMARVDLTTLNRVPGAVLAKVNEDNQPAVITQKGDPKAVVEPAPAIDNFVGMVLANSDEFRTRLDAADQGEWLHGKLAE